MGLVHKLSNGLYKIEQLLAIILCFLMLFSLSAGVLFRYVFSAPLTWSDEVAIYSLVWLTFIGGSMSIKNQSSAAVTIVLDRFKGTLKKILLGISFLIVLLFVCYIFYLSIIWLNSPNISIQRSNSMRMPMIYAYISVPISFLFIIIHSLDLFIRNFRSEKESV